jgi:23S rRNA pseudouridine2605 synthase
MTSKSRGNSSDDKPKARASKPQSRKPKPLAAKRPVTAPDAAPRAERVTADPALAAPPSGEKLQKVLARSGLASRREIERWIEAGRVTVNGKAARLGDRVGTRDRLALDGNPVEPAPAQEARCILYHKPQGEVCSRNDPEGRRTVFEHLPRLKTGRWISIGRLDFNTSGLLLFTTDGELANALMHPSSNIEREYMVRVMGDVQEEMLQRMLDGVMLEDGIARFTDIQEMAGEGINRWFCVVLMEGRNREVRRLFESQGLTVSRLKRVRYGEVFIPSKVKQGQWVELERAEVKSLYRMASLAPKEMQRVTVKERETMERQFNKRSKRPTRSADKERSARTPGKKRSRT